MKLSDLFEEEDDWEPEPESVEWTTFKVQPREGSAGWTPFMATSKVFDQAFGAGNWGQSGIPKEGTFLPMKVSIKPGVKINYAPLRDHGFKIMFFESGAASNNKRHLKIQLRDSTAEWDSFGSIAAVFNEAFGKGNWSHAGMPVSAAYPMHIIISQGTKINYAPLRDRGYKIIFLEGDLEYRKVHTKEDLPKRIHISKSYYMELHDNSSITSYIVMQMLGDNVGAVFIHKSIDEGMWHFVPSSTLFKAGSFNKDDFKVYVSQSQMFNALKLKWWVQNRLIQLKLLPPITQVKEDRRDENFGFRPEYKQFWFEIFNPDLFYAVQHEWEIARGSVRTTHPNGSFIEMILNDYIMKAKYGHEGYSTATMINPSKADVGKPLVFMYDPKKGSPDIRKMKDYGLKPRFLEIDDAE